MEKLKDLGAGWRKPVEAKLKKLGFTVFNPCNTKKLNNEIKAFKDLEKHGFDLEKSRKYFKEIVKVDLDNVFTCNILLVKWDNDVMSAGTAGEITFAKALNIPIVMVIKKEELPDLSKWILGCVSKFVHNMNDAIEEVVKITQNHYFRGE